MPPRSTKGEDNIVVTVPYMTTTIKDWIVFVTPGANSYIEDPAGLQVLQQPLYGYRDWL